MHHTDTTVWQYRRMHLCIVKMQGLHLHVQLQAGGINCEPQLYGLHLHVAGLGEQ